MYQLGGRERDRHVGLDLVQEPPQAAQIGDNVSFVRGAHVAKVGVAFSNIRYFGNFRNFRDGQYTFATDRPFSVSDPSTHPLQFVIVEGGTTWDARANALGVFGQDSWRLSPRLVLNYGIRYDTDNSLAISGAKRVHTLSPRLGLAWSLGQQAKTVVRVSGGVFHDSEHTNLADIFILNNRLLDRAVILNGNPAFGGLFNPFYDPADPSGSAARLRQYLADAYAQGRTPDLSAIAAKSLTRGVNGIDRDFAVPVNRQLTLGVAHELTRSMAVSADLIYSKPKSLLVWRNVNVSPGGKTIDPNFGSKTFAGSLAEATYRAVALRFDLHQARGYAGLSYTWARCDDNTSGTLGGNAATNPFDLEVDAGPCDTDIHHTLAIRGGTHLPLGLEVSSIFTGRSAPPYSAVTSASLPLFTRYEPRNRRRGSDFFSWDIRLGRETRIKRLSARVFLEAFNVLNHRNFSAYVANVTSAQFGQVSDAFPPRRLQIGLRMDF